MTQATKAPETQQQDAQQQKTHAQESISPEQLHAIHADGARVDLVDVRTPIEFREVHATPARNIPLDTLNPDEVIRERGATDKPLYVICKSGKRASKARQRFIENGHTNVVNVDGGTDAWVAAGLPVERGKKIISLERQVRIAAGLLVLVGALLGYFVNINFLWLSAFIGAGLIFAGVTDTCGMGMLLAKAPWNQVKDDQGACCTS